MSTLPEIESAAKNQSVEERQQLLFWVTQSLRSDDRQVPSPRQFDDSTLKRWLDDDVDDMKRLQGNK